jgi:ATP-binding cassette subfamily B protein
MTTSRELPPALASMWRVLRLGYGHEPALILASFALALASALPDALLALWIKWLGDGLIAGDRRLVSGMALAIGATATGTWFLGVVYGRVQRRFRDRVTIALEAHVAGLQARIATIAHQERPEYLDRLCVLRDQVFVLDHLYMSLFSTCAWIVRLVVVVFLLAAVHPALAALVVFALPTVLTSSWRPAVERAAEERAAGHARLARHLFLVATTASPAKELRLAGIGPRLVRERREAWERWYSPVAAARRTSAAWHALAWAVFGGAYVGAIVFVASGLHAPAGDVLLVLAAGSRLSAYIGATVGEIGFLRGIWLDGSRRLAWLEDYASSVAASADRPAPSRLRDGIRLEGVSFAYPGTGRLVLESVSLELPAGAVVALVGENGAGKTTLVKLLCRMYEPTAGRILVDGVPLASVRTEEWRSRLSGAFQDFFRFELPAREAVGVGDLARLDDAGAVASALERGGAGDVVARLPAGLETRLGPTWPGGVELSHGQWQKLALARGFMRDEPLLLVLDEPTSALDAEAEHALFERWSAAARRAVGGSSDGADGVTVLVSHRFSTVRMADRIVVLDGARVAEVGSHEELMARGGTYAELYAIQAGAYL